MKVMDLMPGIGGRSIAFVNAGFQIVCAVENDIESADIYCSIIQPEKFLLKSIEDVNPEDLPDVDIISGKLLQGTFSRVGSRYGQPEEVANNAIYNIVASKKPLFFLLEAPVRILTQNNRKNVEAILEKYVSLGYNVVYHVFTECEYSGYPVVGKQLYFVGIRKDMYSKEFYFPKSESLPKECLEEDSIDTWYRKVPNNIWRKDFVKGKFYLLERGTLKETKQIHMGLYREMYRVDSNGFRKFTHNELASIKGICDYNFNKCTNKRNMYMKIAYASNVYISEAIAKELKNYVGEKETVTKSMPIIKRDKKKNKLRNIEKKRVVFPKHRITKIHVDELKGIRNLDLSIDGNLTAIMGVNGSGKSTILHALACVYAPHEKGDNYKFSYFFTPNPDSDWKNSRLELTYYDENEQKEVTRLYKKDVDRWSPRYTQRPVRDTYYIGIETCIPEIEIEKQTSFIDYSTNSLNDGLTQKIVQSAAYILNKDYESLTMHKTKKKELFGVHTIQDLTYSSLSMGAGEQRVLKILRLVYSVNSYSLILIDEIDLLLHVTALKKLIMELSKIAVKRNLQIIFTTHSLEMTSLSEYVDIRYLEQLDQKTMVYNSINADMIYEMSNCIDKPIEIYVEDLLAEVIVKQIADELNILGKVKIKKYGAAGNAFVLASSYILKTEDCRNVAIVLDGDEYREDKEKLAGMKKVLSGTEKDHEEKWTKAVSMILQFDLPLKTAPEKYIYDMLVEMDGYNEIVRYAQKLKAVSDSHKWLDDLTVRIGQGEELVLFKIMEIVSQNPKWEGYVKNVRDWLIKKGVELDVVSQEG